MDILILQDLPSAMTSNGIYVKCLFFPFLYNKEASNTPRPGGRAFLTRKIVRVRNATNGKKGEMTE